MIRNNILRRFKLCYGLLICLLLIDHVNATPTVWQTLMQGLQYTEIIRDVGFPNGSIHAFRIDLNRFTLNIAYTNNQQGPLMTVKDLVRQQEALIGINGGFFSPELQAIGLRINNGSVINKFKNISWWSLFLIKNNQAQIIIPQNYLSQNDIDFAIQAGPRLVVNGQITTKLRDGVDNRSALGIDNEGWVVITATQNLFLSTHDFANILALPSDKGGLSCIDALNLDGGSSSQLYANVGGFSLNIPSLSPVSDAILVKERESVIDTRLSVTKKGLADNR